jgi:hypothetical protein
MPANISSPVRSARRLQRHVSANDDSTDDGRVASSPPPPILRNFRIGQTETPASDSPSTRSNTQTRRLGAIGGRSSSQATYRYRTWPWLAIKNDVVTDPNLDAATSKSSVSTKTQAWWNRTWQLSDAVFSAVAQQMVIAGSSYLGRRPPG